MIYITLYYDDLDNKISDLREFTEVLIKRCNNLKRCHEGEQSIQYDILEQYFTGLNEYIVKNKNTILCNLVNITDVNLSDTNIFNKKSN